MYQNTENAALTMRWTLETDASGRTRPVAHWVPAQPAVATHVQEVPQVVHAA